MGKPQTGKPYMATIMFEVEESRVATREFDKNGEVRTRPVVREIRPGETFVPAAYGFTDRNIDDMLAEGSLADVGSPEAAAVHARIRWLAEGGR